MAKVHFTKSYKKPTELVRLLQNRHLIIPNCLEAEKYLQNIGYYNICIIKYFLDIISPNNDFLTKLRWLFVDFPEIDLTAMGFPKGWEMEPIWR